jgi:hypothetical protein
MKDIILFIISALGISTILVAIYNILLDNLR